MATDCSLNTGTGTASTKATFSPPLAVQRSPWHSPVPYLFGGLAAMLALIAFALLILACSYWRFFGRLEINGRRRRDNDVEAGDGEYSEPTKALPVFEENILVIMAGEVKPTFLATPLTSSSSEASSFADHSKDKRCTTEAKEREEKAELTDMPKQHMGGDGDHDQIAAAAAEGRESERMGGDGDDDHDDQTIVTTTTEESKESEDHMGGNGDDQATIIPTTTTMTTTTDGRESENTVDDDDGKTTQTAAAAVAVVNNRKESM